MSNSEDQKFNLVQNDEINLYALLTILWGRKFLLLFLIIFSSLSSVFYALSLPNIYRSDALLANANNEQSNLGNLGNYAGLASMAGIRMPSVDSDRTVEAIERIQSFEFFSNYFLPSISLQNLMAVKNWEPSTNTVFYDEKIFSSELNKWTRDFSYPQLQTPSAQESFETYKDIMSITINEKTSFISLSVKHMSPYVARDWVQKIIYAINESIRDEERIKATRSLDFLNKELLKVNYSKIKESIAQLQQEQLKLLMMIESNEDYIFKTLNSPIAPELKSEPKRKVLVILLSFLGLMMSIILVLLLSFINFKSPDD